MKLVTDTKHYRTVIAKTIRQHFTDGTGDWKNTERRIYLAFPSEKDHKGHPTTIGMRVTVAHLYLNKFTTISKLT